MCTNIYVGVRISAVTLYADMVSVSSYLVQIIALICMGFALGEISSKMGRRVDNMEFACAKPNPSLWRSIDRA